MPTAIAHSHLHLLVNRVHPDTGKAWERWKDQPVIQQVLREEERGLGMREVSGRLASLPLDGRSSPTPAPARRETHAPPLLQRIAYDLAAYERVVEAGRQQSEAETAATAARMRAAEADVATQRAAGAQESFRQAFQKVYLDPEWAERAFRGSADRDGLPKPHSPCGSTQNGSGHC